MVCLSFEQSVLKKQKNKKTTKQNKTKKQKEKKNPGGRVGRWFIRKTMLSGLLFCSVFILAWCSYKGLNVATEEHGALKSSRASLLPALVTKETSAGLPPGSRDPAALFQSQAMMTWGSGRFVLLACEAGCAQLGFHLGSGSVCICMCLPEENCPDLHYGGQSCLLGSCLRCQY